MNKSTNDSKSRKSRPSSHHDDNSQLSQTSSSQMTTSTTVKMNPAEFRRKVADMVRYILCADRKKTGIKRADLIKNVMKEHGREFNAVFQEAKKIFNLTFGYDVTQMTIGKSSAYMLVNALEVKVPLNQPNESVLDWDEESPKMGLLLIILSMIFMNDNCLSQASMWHTLQKLGINKEREHHVFGDVDKLINQELLKQNYFEREKVTEADGFSYNYHLGPRAKNEISKRRILEFVSEIYRTESIESWKSQYREVLESENPSQPMEE